MAKTIIISTTTFFYIFRTLHKSTFLNRELAHSQEPVKIFYKSMNIFIGIHRWIEHPNLLKDNRVVFKLMYDSLDNIRENQNLEFTSKNKNNDRSFPYNCKETSQDRCYYWKKITTKLHTYICFLASCFYFLALDARLSAWVFFSAWGESI